ncbi:hypothetical protein C8Q75DRAFT_2051 [Abortiporus biennis]|nr:hypothetical protein C8Q75DRAFT_2051 [Abortiporus biennis]
MTATRPPIPQVNLKDRIAALQQLSDGHEHHPAHPASLIPTSRSTSGQHTGSLRDKIATFEKKGAVPVPRGSFGIGAPPVDDGSSKKKGELYGNRVPGLSRPTVIPTAHPASSSSSRRRTVSTSTLTSHPSRSATPTFSDIYSEVNSDAEASPSPSALGRYRELSRSPDLVPPGHSQSGMLRSVSETLASYESLDEPLSSEADDINCATTTEPAIDASQSVTVEEHEPLAEEVHESPEIPEELSVQSPPPSAPTIVVSPEPPSEPLDPSPVPQSPDNASPISPEADAEISIPSSRTAPNTLPTLVLPDEPPSPGSIYSAPSAVPTPMSISGLIQDYCDAESPASSTGDFRPYPLSPLSNTISSAEQSPYISDINTEGVHSPVQSPNSISPTRSVRTSVIVSPKVISRPASYAASNRSSQQSGSSGSVPTPQDSIFPSLQDHKEVVEEDLHELYRGLDALSADDSFASIADTSLALDAQDAVIVNESPRVVSPPPITQANLVRLGADSPSSQNRLSVASAYSANSVDGSISGEGDVSLALDTREAVIVSEPPQVVSPTITKGTLVPAPKPPSNPSSPSTLAPSVPEPQPSPSDLLFNKKEVRKSFHAVVHNKVRERKSHEATRPPELQLQSSSYATPRMQKIASTLPEPESPSLGDLAALMADAALLEQHLSAVVTPKKSPLVPTPLSTVVEPPTTPRTPRTFELENRPQPRQEVPESAEVQLEEEAAEWMSDAEEKDKPTDAVQLTKFPTTEPEPEPAAVSMPPEPLKIQTSLNPRLSLPPRSSSLYSAQSATTSMLGMSPVVTQPQRSVSMRAPSTSNPIPPQSPPSMLPYRRPSGEDNPPTPPPKSPKSGYFANLRIRKASMPGAFPRSSYSSEDSSVALATPPSPPGSIKPAARDFSDTSSVRSSSKSWKSPKRSKSGLARAGTFAGKLFNRSKNKSAVDVTETIEEDGHLSASHMQQSPSSPTHLSPFTLPPSPTQPRGAPQSQMRPTSWVSISTTGSGGDVFDTDIYDHFPSVPDVVPPVPPLPPSYQSLNGVDHRQYVSGSHLSVGADFGPTPGGHKSSSMPARSAHMKQRSSMV